MYTDDYLCYTTLELLKSKDQTLQAYKAFAVWAKMQHGTCIKWPWSDHSGKYTGGKFAQFLQTQGTA